MTAQKEKCGASRKYTGPLRFLMSSHVNLKLPPNVKCINLMG